MRDVKAREREATHDCLQEATYLDALADILLYEHQIVLVQFVIHRLLRCHFFEKIFTESASLKNHRFLKMDWLRLYFSKNLSDKPRFENLQKNIYAKVISVYDGDTFTIVMIHNRQIVRRRCRCIGYDSPEIKGSGDEEKKRAIDAKLFIEAYLPKKIFRLKTYGSDKYGRLLVDYKKRGKSLKDVMIENGHGYEYYGGKKKIQIIVD